MPAVVPDNRRDLETGQDLVFPRSFQNGCHYDFVTLVERREAPLRGQVGLVLRAKVAVEVGSGIKRFAQSVIRHHSEGIAEALLDLHNPAFIQRRSRGRIYVVLQQQRIGKTGRWIRAAYGCSPLAE